MNQFLFQCITHDGVGIPHAKQIEQLCLAGAKWIQLRMKQASIEEVKKTALEGLSICQDHEALFIVNDYFDLALEMGAGGVHLGRKDMNWKAARNLAGPEFIIGGTVNSLLDAREALACRSLDYVGVGPFRHTETKTNLSTVLDEKTLNEIVQFLGEMPKVIIGGIKPSDLPAIAELEADGVAVSSGLFADGTIAENFKSYIEAWPLLN